MASTYSALKIELIATGEQSGTWGTTTNTNLGDAALGEAITGSADVAFSSADVTVTLTDTNATQAARNLRLNLTGTSGGARNLILGSGCQIEKFYVINNTLADAVTVKNTTGTGVAVAAGKTMPVFNNGTNVVDVTTYLTSLTLGSALPVTSGGTGSSSTTFVNAATNVTGTLPIANGGTGSSSTTFVNAATNITGTLPLANGGTGATSLAAATIATQGYTTTATAAGTTTLTVSSTQLQFFTGATTQTVVLPVASTLTVGQRFEIHNNSTGSVTVQSSGLNTVATVLGNTTTVCTCILTSGTTAASWDADIQGFTTTLPVAQGGTGLSTLTDKNVILGAGTSTVTFVAPGSSGNVLTSDGTTWTSAAAGGGGSFQSQLFTSPGTWTKPSSATQVRIQIIGGGGAQSGNTPLGVSGIGGSGGYAYVSNIPVSGPVAVTVGSSPGGTSSFGSAVSCTGGGNGSTSGQTTPIMGSAGTATVSSGTTLRAIPGSSYNNLPFGIQVSSAFNGSKTPGAYSATGGGGAGLGQDSAVGQNGVGGAVLVEFVG